jgi:tRNA(adenine34) deaminase
MELSGQHADDIRWMECALELARVAGDRGEVPVGAVVIQDGEIVAEGHNLTVCDRDPTAHAEVVAIRAAAAALSSSRLLGCTLYVTLEPCAMCAGALVLSKIERLVFGALDPKSGMVASLGNLVQEPRLNHRLEVTGEILSEACGDLLRDFFRSRRA